MNYYNDNDHKAAAWLRELIAQGLIPEGGVDARSVADVQPEDIEHYTQCHFFAGIGGWPYALSLAGWPKDRPVWTASCPCQPFSIAGKRHGEEDPRHLWPVLYERIRQCRPPVIFGEQVASKDGRLWLTGVRASLEALGYALGASDLCAAGVGAPHIRQRLFWVAYPKHAIRGQEQQSREAVRYRQDPGRQEAHGQPGACGQVCGLGIPGRKGLAQQRGHPGVPRQEAFAGQGEATIGAGPWSSNAEWLLCLDGKARRIEPSAFPLAHGVPARVVRLRGYGNAIVPELAAEFIQAAVEAVL